MTRDILNDKAQERFQQLKKKFHLNQISSVLPTSIQDQIRNEVTMKDSIDKVIKRTEDRLTYDAVVSEQEKEIAEEKAQFVDNSFNFIESLNLPPQLSLAIGLIISGYKTDSITDFSKARDTIKEYMYNKGMFK